MDAWLEGPYFVAWLSKFKNDIGKARCSLCQKTIELSTNRRSALSDHAKGKKYGDLAVTRKNFFFNLNLLKPFPTLKLLIIISKHWTILSQEDSSKAEIIWLLKYVMSVCSLRFNEDLEDTLCVIYPWLGSVKNFSMARSMSMYSVAPTIGLRLISRHCFKQS